jgi:hypothetical protein
MRQTHSLIHPRHKPPQALAAVKNKVRKYIKRERRKKLPEGVEFWDFDCRVGVDEETAAELHISAVIEQIDAVSRQGATGVYVEILVKPGVRKKRAQSSLAVRGDDSGP